MNTLRKAYREYEEYVVSSLLYDDNVDSFAEWAGRHYGLNSFVCTSYEYMQA